jgi:hypothetical protein
MKNRRSMRDAHAQITLTLNTCKRRANCAGEAGTFFRINECVFAYVQKYVKKKHEHEHQTAFTVFVVHILSGTILGRTLIILVDFRGHALWTRWLASAGAHPPTGLS